MNELCPIHQLPWKTISAGISKKTGKPYNSFQVCPVEGCNEKPEKASIPRPPGLPPRPAEYAEAVAEFVPKVEDPAEEFKKSLGEEEEGPMTRKDWNSKEFVKGLAIYSSQARQEGMDPVTAFKTMHIAEWLRLAYGDLAGFDEWILKVKNRLKNLGETE